MRLVAFLLTLLSLLLSVTAGDAAAIAKRQINRQDVVARASRTRNRRAVIPSPASPFYLRLSSPATSYVMSDGTSAGFFKPTTSVTQATSFVLNNGNVQIAGTTSPAQFIKVTYVASYLLSCPSGVNCGTIVPLTCSFNSLWELSCTSSLDPAAPNPTIQDCGSAFSAFIWQRGLYAANCVVQTFTAVPVGCV